MPKTNTNSSSDDNVRISSKHKGALALALLIVFVVLFLWNDLLYLIRDDMYSGLIPLEWDSTLLHASKEKLHLRGSAVIPRVNEPNLLFVGGERGQAYDLIWQYDLSKKLLAIWGKIAKHPNEQTTAACVAKMNNVTSGINLIIARTSGVYICDEFNKFAEPRKIWEQAHTALVTSLSVADIDRSDSFAIYVACFTKPEFFKSFQFKMEGTARNALLINDSLKWQDKAREFGCDGDRNTWTAAFVDLNDNGYPDIVEATDEGECRIYMNLNGSFTMIKVEMPIGFWMGMAMGDFNNSGRQSMFFSNSGGTVSTRMMEIMGAKKENMPTNMTDRHCILYNNGNYNFTVHTGDDINKTPFRRSRIGFGWGAMAHDLNNTGRIDIIMAQNWHMIPWQTCKLGRNHGAVLIKNRSGSYERIHKFSNMNFGVTPLLDDLTGNGKKDIIWINHMYKPVVYRNRLRDGIKSNQKIQVELPKTVEFANATVVAHYKSNKVLSYQNILGGTGLGSCQSSCFDFGTYGDKIVSISLYIRGKLIGGIPGPEVGKKYNNTSFVSFAM